MNDEVMYLVVLGMKQHLTALAAAEVHSVRAGDENGWCIYCRSVRWQFYHRQIDALTLEHRTASALCCYESDLFGTHLGQPAV